MQREAESIGTSGGLAAPPLRLNMEDRLALIADRLASLSGWRRWLAAAMAGMISVLAMAPFHLWPVLMVTLPALIWLIEGTLRTSDAAAGGRLDLDRRRFLDAAIVGWCFGYGFHVAGLYWLREAFLVTGGGLAMLWPLGVLGLPAYLALFHGLAAGCAAMHRGPGLSRILALGLTLAAAEWLRGHAFTGFPWNVLGMALTFPLTLMQSSGVIGIYGLTLVTVWALAGPAVVLAASRSMPPGSTARALRRVGAAMLLIGPLAIMVAYGSYRLARPLPPMVDGVRIRLVQPSLPQREKWMAEKQPEHLQRQLDLTRRGPDGKEDGLAGITHVVWPEAAMPFLPLQRPPVLAAIAEALPEGVHLLAGILRMERVAGSTATAGDDQDYRIFNSLVSFDDQARPVAIYDKTHLVPFGEYLPFPGFLESIGLRALTRQRGGFAIGPSPRPLLRVPGLPPAGPLICYEAVFPGTSRQSVARPAFLLNVTNDGWFGNSTGPRQHLHQARLRSVEEGLPLMRVANNGITAVFDSFGRELARLDLDRAGVIDTPLPAAVEPPVYARFGDLAFVLLWCAGLIALLMGRNRPAQQLPSQGISPLL